MVLEPHQEYHLRLRDSNRIVQNARNNSIWVIHPQANATSRNEWEVQRAPYQRIHVAKCVHIAKIHDDWHSAHQVSPQFIFSPTALRRQDNVATANTQKGNYVHLWLWSKDQNANLINDTQATLHINDQRNSDAPLSDPVFDRQRQPQLSRKSPISTTDQVQSCPAAFSHTQPLPPWPTSTTTPTCAALFKLF